ncbi:MAG: NAD(P)H-hydrate dehydratase [Actinomycetales bacterium]|nr:NAD(P)H-hydrate dehydratase [Actinomycetales bacterium]
MIRGYDADAVRAAEAPALAAGVPLMQRAAHALALTVVRELAARGVGGTGTRVLVLVGGGNNGGDGLYAAAYLARRGVRATVALLHRDVHAEGLQAARTAGAQVLALAEAFDGAEDGGAAGALAELDRRATDADAWVDALAGIGVSGALREPLAGAVSRLIPLREGLAVKPLVVAVDTPSGIRAGSGAVAGPVLRADVTVTMGGMKAGLLLPPAARYAGRVQVVELGLEEALLAGEPTVSRLTGVDVADLWPVPDDVTHKYTRGVVGIVAGSADYPGAAVLATSGALRAGCGMVRYVGPPEVTRLVIARHPEVVPGTGRVQAWVAGPGLHGDDQRATARAVMARAVADGVGMVCDAGALDLLPGREDLTGARIVLTPHAGELASLLSAHGQDVERAEVEADPARWARRAVELTGATVLLKGAVTVVAGADGTLFSQDDGTGWLATAGSGDVLAGLLGALLAQTDAPAAVAAAAAALVHGRSGRLASGGGPITAMDVADALPATVRDLLRTAGRLKG